MLNKFNFSALKRTLVKSGLFFLLFFISFFTFSQIDEAYLKLNAVRVDDPTHLNEEIYKLLSPFQIIMFGEMHGTNEATPFVSGLADLFTRQGDSLLVGLEIPPELMIPFLTFHTEKSIYESAFFKMPATSGKESFPWAELIAELNKNKKIILFFFDLNEDEKNLDRDSIMAMKIKMQFKQHPHHRMITLSGNYHNRITEPGSMTSVLKNHLNVSICSLNMEYKEGTAHANFGNGLEYKNLGSIPSVINTSENYERYLLLQPANNFYDYNGFYFIKTITPATMTTNK